MLDLDPKTTALVLIDLQKGIVGRELAPRSGAAVVDAAKNLAGTFRKAGAPVVLVTVAFAKDFADAPSAKVDVPMPVPPGGLPEDFSELAPDLAQTPDIRVIKRHWGAFHGTDLDIHLRRRGITTVVLGGIATNFGVESTAREAWQHGYDVVLAEDLTTSTDAALHDVAVRHILPRLSRIKQASDIRLRAA